MEDSMAEDTIQASTPTVPTFGQQPITPAAFGFGMASSNVPHPPGVGISLTLVKLNDSNYLLWSRAIKKYLTAQAMEKYLTDTKPADDAKEYQKWVQEDAMVTTWLWNSMEPSIATSTMWVDTTKELWDSLLDRFGQSKNISQTTALPTATLAQTAAPSSQPAFGNPSSVNPFGTIPSNNNNQIGMEDSMVKDTIQASIPLVPAFGQQPITPAASGFGFNMAAQPNMAAQSIPKDGVIFRTPETLVPAAASTSASAPSIFSFGVAASSSSLNNGTLASSPSVTPSSMSPLASNTFTSQNLFNSSTTDLSTTDSIAASTTTTSATTTFTAAPIFNFGSSAVLSTSVSPLSATFGVESTEPKTKDAVFGNSTGTPVGGTSAFTTTQSNIFSGTSPAIAGTGSSIFGSTLSAVTSTESSISVGVSTPVTSAGGVFGSTSPITGTGNSIFGFSAGGSSAATSQSLFPNSFTAGSAQASGTENNGVVTSTQTMPVQFGSSATSSSFGLTGNAGFSSSSSPFGSSISAAKPFSSAPSFGLNSATSLSEANSGSGTTPSVFGSSWQAPKSATLFGSSTSAPFQFSASASSVATNSAPVFGASTGAPSGSLFPFTSTAAAPSSQPAFGNPSSVNPFGTAPSNNNDQIGMEDSMAEDTIQASTPSVPAFGQQPITPAASGFGFNMAAQPNMTGQPSPFQFSSQQNVANPQNSTLFQSSNSLEFNAAAAGGSFSLGSGGGDKSNRRIVKIKSKQRRK